MGIYYYLHIWAALGGHDDAEDALPMADPSPDLTTAASGLIGPVITALVGVLMRHSQLVQSGERKFFSAALVLEMPTVAGMGVVGGGVGSYLGAPEIVTWSIAAVLGWLGPHVLTAIAKAAAKRAGIPAEEITAAPQLYRREEDES